MMLVSCVNDQAAPSSMRAAYNKIVSVKKKDETYFRGNADDLIAKAWNLWGFQLKAYRDHLDHFDFLYSDMLSMKFKGARLLLPNTPQSGSSPPDAFASGKVLATYSFSLGIDALDYLCITYRQLFELSIGLANNWQRMKKGLEG